MQDKAGVKRVVWRRSRMVLNGLRRTNITEDIPFLAVSRSLGKALMLHEIVFDFLEN